MVEGLGFSVRLKLSFQTPPFSFAIGRVLFLI